jgi:hypothetical protein
MSILRNRGGQAMIEGCMTILFLVFFFICNYCLFMMGFAKIRSLDTAYHIARADQVNSYSYWPLIAEMCFGKLGLGPGVTSNQVGAVPTHEVAFNFMPRTLWGGISIWKSVMRVPMADNDYLSYSYRGAERADTSPNALSLLAESKLVEQKARASAQLDEDIDIAADVAAAAEAGR